MVDIKSKDTLLSEFRAFLKAYNNSLDTSDNSLAKDLLLLPYSIGIAAVMDQVAIARDLGILSKLTGTNLDQEATNYNLERLPGNYAAATLTFYTTTAPTSDVVIPGNTQATTAGTSFVSPVVFSTVAESRFSLSDFESYYNYDRDRYEFPVTAIATTIGSIGNVASNLITKLSSTISGISGVTNLTAATGGSDSESDDDLGERIKKAKTGRDLNTVSGLQEYMRTAGFLDAYPVRVEDADAERATGIDVFVINASSTAYTETMTYDPAQTRYYLTQRPVIAVTGVVGSIVGTLSSSQYSAYIDNTTGLRRSIYAQDYIVIDHSANMSAGEVMTVTYNYASLVRQVQGTLDLNANNVLTADPLVKRAIPLYLYLNATLTLKSNADGPTTRNRIKNALGQFMATYRLGDAIQKSDLIVVLQNGYGDYTVTEVDAVVLSSYYLQDSSGTQRSPVSEVITVSNKEYALYGSATLI